VWGLAAALAASSDLSAQADGEQPSTLDGHENRADDLHA
jgi:hypothetical protein